MVNTYWVSNVTFNMLDSGVLFVYICEFIMLHVGFVGLHKFGLASVHVKFVPNEKINRGDAFVMELLK